MFVPGQSFAQIRASFGFLLGLVVAYAPAPRAVAATITVTSTADAIAPSRGDALCTAGAVEPCTLRAAILRANALAGPDTIVLQANATYLLTRVGADDTGTNGDLDILGSVTIVGAGPASTVIDGNGFITGDRVVHILPNHVVNISGVTIRQGQATETGGGISNGGTLTLVNSTVANNTTGSSGGAGAGIYTSGPLTLVDSTVRDNMIVGVSIFPFGGGVLVAGTTATISGSTISGNSAWAGGGIFAGNAALNLINTTISGNSSRSNGGGLYMQGGTAGLYNVTIHGNQANSDASGTDTGAGIFHSDGSISLRNSIVSGNVVRQGTQVLAPDDCSGMFTSAGNNIVTSVVAAHCAINGSYSSATPLLGFLQSNGGPTLTHALLGGSAGIDDGNPTGCVDNFGAILTTDQRGEPRPFGAACDIGAFEFGDTIFNDGFES